MVSGSRDRQQGSGGGPKGGEPGLGPYENRPIAVYVGRTDRVEIAYMRLRLAELEEENRMLKQKLRDQIWHAILKYL